jgi:hypothetical protein
MFHTPAGIGELITTLSILIPCLAVFGGVEGNSIHPKAEITVVTFFYDSEHRTVTGL